MKDKLREAEAPLGDIGQNLVTGDTSSTCVDLSVCLSVYHLAPPSVPLPEYAH